MKQTEMYSINLEDKTIVVRLKSDLVDEDSLMRLLDYLELESIRKRSKLTEEGAAALTEEINQEVWADVKERLASDDEAINLPRSPETYGPQTDGQ
jgi:hypothetical protein